ncbi:MAG: hypothetical protein Tp118SUR00d2C21406351_35 [Prokaryotic dsDNA virus sp.]|nr:MAG: hypothetical protein Tp118SUR00d2C21406351_35 [Prokaryotic dsDNA virus sp.]
MTTEQLRAFIVANEGDALDVMKRKMYDAALIECYGNVSKAARMLGISRSKLSNYANQWEPKR